MQPKNVKSVSYTFVRNIDKYKMCFLFFMKFEYRENQVQKIEMKLKSTKNVNAT